MNGEHFEWTLPRRPWLVKSSERLLATLALGVAVTLTCTWIEAASPREAHDVPSGVTKDQFFSEMRDMYGAENWKCGPEPRLPGIEVCGAAVPRNEPAVSARWSFEAIPFRFLLGQFESNRLLGVSYAFGSQIGPLAWTEVTSRLTKRLGPPASSATISGWMGHTWKASANRRLVVLIHRNDTVEVSYAPESVYLGRFGEKNTAILFRPNDACKPKMVNLCEIARKFVDASAAQLPLRMNRNAVLSHIVPEGPMIVAVVQLAYDKGELTEQLEQAGASQHQLLVAMTNAAREGLCRKGSIAEAFVTDGGTFRYDYRGADGKLVAQVPLSSC